ncbi:MAG: ABC transporter permease [Thermoplasmata archaeon]|nr:ABC transporter permease [Thermoplasmata archaeon]
MALNTDEPLATQVRAARRPNPRIAQMKRTWYFFRRNTLGMVGLAILIMIAVVAIYGATQPLSWLSMTQYCSTNFGPLNSASGYNSTTHGGAFLKSDVYGCAAYVCTYETVLPTNYLQFCNGQWYKIPAPEGSVYPGAVAPTLNLGTFSSGPMPLGGLSTAITGAFPVFNLADGMLRGADWSLIFSVSIVGIGAMAGLIIGAIAGLWGGYVDEAIMRLVDIFLSIPVILFVIVTITVVVSVASQNASLAGPDTELSLLILAFAAVWWPFYARIVRGQVLVVREQKYVEAARASGAKNGRILFRHIIPNSMYPVFIQFSLDVGTIPLLIGGLVFLGFHIFPNDQIYFPELGTISALAVQNLSDYLVNCTLPGGGCVIPWWQLLFPGLSLFLYAISVNLLSDGLRDALDPRLRR